MKAAVKIRAAFDASSALFMHAVEYTGVERNNAEPLRRKADHIKYGKIADRLSFSQPL